MDQQILKIATPFPHCRRWAALFFYELPGKSLEFNPTTATATVLTISQEYARSFHIYHDQTPGNTNGLKRPLIV